MVESTTSERVEQYDSVEHMVREFKKLLDRPRSAAPRSADWRRQLVRSSNRGLFDWTPLDNVGEVGVLLTVMREARLEIGMCHPDAGCRMWRAWLEVRFDGKTLRDYPAGYKKTAAGVAVAAVDEEMRIELAVRGKLTKYACEHHGFDFAPSNGAERVVVVEHEVLDMLGIVYPPDVRYPGEDT